MKHRIEYAIYGPGSGDTSYSASCVACGEYLESYSATAVTQWGPAHVAAALDTDGVTS